MANTVSRIISDDQLNKIIQIESAGKVRAKALTSSATGLFQFLNATWDSVVSRHRPDLLEGHTLTEVRALRTDPSICIELGARFTEDNARILGPGWTDGDLYLSHFLGAGAARKVLRASPNERVEPLVGSAAVNANTSILKGKTAGQVRAWAQRSMETKWAKAGKPDWIAIHYIEPRPSEVAGPVGPSIPDDAVAAKTERMATEVAAADVGTIDEVSAASKTKDVPVNPKQRADPGPVRGDADIWNVQRRLRAMNFNPGGLDGEWGPMTAGAIFGFINARALDIQAPTSRAMFVSSLPKLSVELSAAEAERFVQPVTPERANADFDKVAQVEPAVVPVRRNFLAAAWSSVVAFFVAAYNVVSDQLSSAWEFFTGVKDQIPGSATSTFFSYLGKVPTSVWFGLAALGLGWVALNSFRSVKGITEAVQSGERQ